MARVLLVHWNVEAAPQREKELRRAGHDVELLTPRGQADFRPVFERPPDVLLVDLDRRPSEGRVIAVWLRQRKATRDVPIVFAGGEPAKVEPIRELLPDASFAKWDDVADAVRDARAPAMPVVPGTMDAYAGTGLVPKLGIRAGSTVALLGAPDGFAAKLAPLPAEAKLEARGPAEVVLLFVRTRAELNRSLETAKRSIADRGSLWIVWPKRASGVASDLTQPVVRATGMARGLVDYKVAAIDETWTGLRFARRPR